MQRDKEVNAALKELGYTVFRFWENKIKKELDACLKEVIAHLNNQKEAKKRTLRFPFGLEQKGIVIPILSASSN